MIESDAERAVRFARSVLDGSTSAFLGCKILLPPLCKLGVHSQKPFITITAIESELDEFPVWPEERKLWNEESLAREDAKLAKRLPEIQEDVFEACRAIVERFDNRK